MAPIKYVFLILILFGESSCSKNTFTAYQEKKEQSKKISKISDTSKYKKFLDEEFYECRNQIDQNISGIYDKAVTFEILKSKSNYTICIFNNKESLFVYPPNLNCNSIFDSTSAKGIISEKAAIKIAEKNGFEINENSIINLDLTKLSNFKSLSNQTKTKSLPSILKSYDNSEMETLAWIFINPKKIRSQVAYVEATVGETVVIEALKPSH